VFIATLPSKARDADHREHGSSTVACFRFRVNVFTEQLPSNELFRLSDVMSQYDEFLLNFALNVYIRSIDACLLSVFVGIMIVDPH
jgi:hypothetical protein